MKRLKIILFLCLFASFLFADWSEKKEFLDTAEASIASGVTVTEGTDYDSNTHPVVSEVIAITCEFAIASGDGENSAMLPSTRKPASTWTTRRRRARSSTGSMDSASSRRSSKVS